MQNAFLKALRGEREGDLRRHGALSHSALSRENHDCVLYGGHPSANQLES